MAYDRVVADQGIWGDPYVSKEAGSICYADQSGASDVKTKPFGRR